MLPVWAANASSAPASPWRRQRVARPAAPAAPTPSPAGKLPPDCKVHGGRPALTKSGGLHTWRNKMRIAQHWNATGLEKEIGLAGVGPDFLTRQNSLLHCSPPADGFIEHGPKTGKWTSTIRRYPAWSNRPWTYGLVGVRSSVRGSQPRF